MLRFTLTALALLLALPAAAQEQHHLVCSERSNMLRALDTFTSDSDHLNQIDVGVAECEYAPVYSSVALNEYYDARRVYYNFRTGFFFTFMPIKARGVGASIKYVLLNAGRLDEFCISNFHRDGFHGAPEMGAMGYLRPPSHSLQPQTSNAQYPAAGLEGSEINHFQVNEMGCRD